MHRLSSWYNNSITRRLSSSFSIQFYIAETVLLRGTEKRILNCEEFVSYIERKMTEPKSQSQDEVIGIQKHKKYTQNWRARTKTKKKKK